jgi:hypothetical protein
LRVQDEVQRAAFTGFSSTSTWYEGVGPDMGLACVRSDGTSLVVMVATDSD